MGGIAALVALGGVWKPFVILGVLAAAAFAVALAADLAAGPRHRDMILERGPVEHFALRVKTRLRYVLTNRSKVAVRFGIVDTPVERLRYDIDDLGGRALPRSQTSVDRPVTPVARGGVELGTLYLWFENAIGLLRRRARVAANAHLRVYPDLSAVERYGKLHARNRLIDAGLRRIRMRGIGSEFESLRDWSAGDAFRAIDWKATARRGRLMVAQYEVERSQNVMLVLDAGRLMTARAGEQRKFDYAVTAALSVASIARLASDKIGFVAFAGTILEALAPRATAASLAHLGERLYDLEPRFEESDYAEAFAYLRTHLRKRSLVAFFTDMIDPVAQSTVLAEVGSLARRHVVVCIFMNDAAIERALAREPETVLDAYAESVAFSLERERRSAVATLERLGVLTIDVPAAQLSTALVDRYLRIKQRGLL